MSAHSFPPAGGGRGSEQSEGESQCFLGCRHQSPCMFHLRVHVSGAGWFGGVGMRGSGSRKCTLVVFKGRGECVCFECKTWSKSINWIRNESQQVVLETHRHRCRHIHQPKLIVLSSHITCSSPEKIFSALHRLFSQ